MEGMRSLMGRAGGASTFMKKSLSSYYTDPVVKHGYCRGSEPVSYVREILERYQHYKNRIEL